MDISNLLVTDIEIERYLETQIKVEKRRKNSYIFGCICMLLASSFALWALLHNYSNTTIITSTINAVLAVIIVAITNDCYERPLSEMEYELTERKNMRLNNTPNKSGT